MLQGTSESHLASPLLKIAILRCKNSNFFLTTMENNTNKLNDLLHIPQSSYTKLPLELQITQKNLFHIFFCFFLKELIPDFLTAEKLIFKDLRLKAAPQPRISRLSLQHLLFTRKGRGATLLSSRRHNPKTLSDN